MARGPPVPPVAAAPSPAPPMPPPAATPAPPSFAAPPPPLLVDFSALPGFVEATVAIFETLQRPLLPRMLFVRAGRRRAPRRPPARPGL